MEYHMMPTFFELTSDFEVGSSSIEKKTKTKKKFNPDEDSIITEQVTLHGEKGWRKIAEHIPGRTARQCRERWKNYLSPSVSNSPWSIEEDEKLIDLVQKNGQQWSKIAQFFKLRTDVTLKNRYSFLKRKSIRNSEPILNLIKINNPEIKEETQIDITNNFNDFSFNDEWNNNELDTNFDQYNLFF